MGHMERNDKAYPWAMSHDAGDILNCAGLQPWFARRGF